MKRMFLFLTIMCIAILSTSCPYGGGCPSPYPGKYPGYNKRAIVYLHVLKEDGSPLEDSHAKNFILDYCAKSSYNDMKTIINENDYLIFECSEFYVTSEGEVPTASEVVRTLDNDYWFALKDTPNTYKTVRKTYKETYKSYEINKDPKTSYGYHSYIYHCEVQLEKKQP